VRKTVNDKKTLSDLEQLYELTFSLDLLKNRLIDYSTFEICEVELKNIARVFNEVVSGIANHKSALSDVQSVLDTAITPLEIIFENTLQIVCADPAIFLFFVRELYALSGKLNAIKNKGNC